MPPTSLRTRSAVRATAALVVVGVTPAMVWASAGTAWAGGAPSSPWRAEAYVVRSGDTVTAIARHYRVQVGDVVATNHLRADGFIVVGQRLTIRVPTRVRHGYPAAVTAAAARHRSMLSRRELPSTIATRSLIIRTARAFRLNPALALAIAWQESGFQQRVVSPADAVGVMQVLPSTGDYVGSELVHHDLDLLDPADNVTAGVALLRSLVDVVPLRQAVAGYYQGLASLRRHGELPETRAYIADVLRLRQTFADCPTCLPKPLSG